MHGAEIIRSGYAIEYDCINPLELLPTLQHKKYAGLYFAGQINGTSGYEEAAAQGLLAGINCGLYVANKAGIVLSRTNSYIGVLVDDLTTLGTNEPYRIFTARAEHRLSLRQDNADARLTPIGRSVGLVDDKRFAAFTKKQKMLSAVRASLTPAMKTKLRQGQTLPDIPPEIVTEIRYEGYIAREQSAIAEIKRQEAAALPADIDYSAVSGLRKEAQIKLNAVRPMNIGQASRISGVTPADITVLLINLRRKIDK